MAECRRIDPNHVGPHCGCAGDACALDAPRPTSELAADVRAGFVRAFDPDAKLRLPNPAALAALSALVARVTDLEAHATRITDAWQAAEAQVAALTQERDAAVSSMWGTSDSRNEWRDIATRAEARAVAAEAALRIARMGLLTIAEPNGVSARLIAIETLEKLDART